MRKKKVDIPDEFVERKLSGIYSSPTIDIPWSTFEDYMNYAQEYLRDEHGLELDQKELMIKKRIVNTFERKMHDILDSIAKEPSYYFSWDIDDLLENTFKTEIAKADEEAAEAERLENERQLAEAKVRIQDGGLLMKFDPNDFQRLKSILQMYHIHYE